MGVQTNLRKPAVFLFAGRSSVAGGLDVSESLALADDLFRRGTRVPGRRAGRAAEASRPSRPRPAIKPQSDSPVKPLLQLLFAACRGFLSIILAGLAKVGIHQLVKTNCHNIAVMQPMLFHALVVDENTVGTV